MSVVLHTELGNTVLADTSISHDTVIDDVPAFLKPRGARPTNTNTNTWNCADHFPWPPPAIDIRNATNIVESVIASRINGEKVKREMILPPLSPTSTTTTTPVTKNGTQITSLETLVRSSYTDGGVLVSYALVNSPIHDIKQELVSRGALLCTLHVDCELIAFLNTRELEMCLPVTAPAASPFVCRVAAIVGYTQDHWIVEPALGCGSLHISVEDPRISTHKLFGFLSRQQKQKQTARDEHAPDTVPVYLLTASKKVKTKNKPKTVLTLNHGASKGAHDVGTKAGVPKHGKLPQKLRHMFTAHTGAHADATYLVDILFIVIVFICAALLLSALFSKRRNLLA